MCAAAANQGAQFCVSVGFQVSHAETVIREVNASADDTFVIPPDCFEAMAQDIEDFCRGRPDPGPGYVQQLVQLFCLVFNPNFLIFFIFVENYFTVSCRFGAIT